MPNKDTTNLAYTRYLKGGGWKRFVPVQLPYRLHLHGLRLGQTLDIGCGVGRNLRALSRGSVGIDHNPSSVKACRELGLEAYLPDAFPSDGGRFDSLLFAHVLEHMRQEDAIALVQRYLPLLKPSGRIVIFTPQEKGYASDASHVEFVDFAGLNKIADALSLRVMREYSFPFPRPVGRVFAYNEFVVILKRA